MIFHRIKDSVLKDLLWGKGENAGDRHFLIFPQCFMPIERKFLTFNI